MHPEMIRYSAALRIEEWLSAAEADRRAQRAGHSRRGIRIHMPSWRPRHRVASTARHVTGGRQATTTPQATTTRQAATEIEATAATVPASGGRAATGQQATRAA